jgi:hypothetical protein
MITLRRSFGSLIFLTGLIILWSGCSSGPPEPTGEPVVLSESDYNPSMKGNPYYDHFAWSGKVLQLMGSHEYWKAVYCSHQAIKTWAEAKDKATAQDLSPAVRYMISGGICVEYDRLGSLYTCLREPKWALKYHDLALQESPSRRAYHDRRAVDLYMLGHYPEAVDECSKGGEVPARCELLQAGVVMHRDNVDKGKQMIREAWTRIQASWPSQKYKAADVVAKDNAEWLEFCPQDIVDVIQEKSSSTPQ